uniref:Uncharacterized protein n=1 Tax=Rhizophora mucronata TaxID=61149 RepID=A0A2P2NIA5_RHIMU
MYTQSVPIECGHTDK